MRLAIVFGAAALIVQMVAWMRRHGPAMRRELVARGARGLNTRWLFRVSEVLLLLVAASLPAAGIDQLIALDWIAPGLDPVWDSSALLAGDAVFWAITLALLSRVGRRPAALAVEASRP
ncbi:hypothetical protein [Ideonella sp.]|uniref:hypothetical protein n=1 Tax=Ideonella sp. TaxID=1929293 RepID=UPI002B49A6C1|nr:hypothetical protein [Ideonella sp.]HJV67630.1 hypothetical protein [Ideonella sp.]